MKKIVILFTLFFTFANAEVAFMHDYQKAVAKAKKENKRIMLMLTKENCQACWWMEHTAFKNEALKSKIESNFISVQVDVEKGNVPMNLEYLGTPTFYFLTKNQDQESRIDGALNVKKFTARIDFMIGQ